MFCVGFLYCILYGVASVSSVPAVVLHFKVFYLKRLLSCSFMSFFGFFFLTWFHLTQEVSICLPLAPSLSLSVSFLSLSRSLSLCQTVWFAFLNSLPSPPLPSTVNKLPEPTPRRASTVNRKQPQLTSPTFQPPLPPLEATLPEPQPQALPPATEAEQPGLSGAGGGAAGIGGLGGGVHVATVQPQIVAQLSAEESR